MEDLVRIINEDSNSENEKLRAAINSLIHTNSDNNPSLFSQLLTDVELIYYYDIKDYVKAYIFAKEAFENDPTDMNLSNLKYCEQAMGLEPKIIVYTIMKNELDNIEPWLENIKDADDIYVLDTGSTDGSYELMTSLKEKYPQLEVSQKTYEKFRFDVARNDNLAMVPNEPNIVCWTIDLDERFEDNWYEVTKNVYYQNPFFYKLEYYYVPDHYEDGTPTQKLIYNKCHRRLGAAWTLPIHEQMAYGIYDKYYNGNNVCFEDNILVHHYQNKTADRNQYVNLLETRINENLYDFEAINHLATEYRNHQKNYQKEIDTRMILLGRGIVGNANWLECMAGNIAWALSSTNLTAASKFYEMAIAFNPTLRTYYLKYASLLLDNEKYEEALQVILDMENANTVPCNISWKEYEGAWQELPYLLKAQIYERMHIETLAKENYKLAKDNLDNQSVHREFIRQKCEQYNI